MSRFSARRALGAAILATALGLTAACGAEVPDAEVPAGGAPTAEPTDPPTASGPTTDEPTTPEPTVEPTTPPTEPTTEPTEPTTEPTEPTSGGPGGAGTQDDPLSIGETGQVADYDLTVTGVNPDAESLVMDENEFNDPPGDGEVFVLMDVEMTYRGDAEPYPWLDVWVEVLGGDGGTYSGSCGTIPNDLIMITDVEPDQPITGAYCVRMPQDAVAGGVIAFSPLISMEDEDIIYVSVAE